MSNISIETSQNVTISYNYASLGTRVGAWMLDAVVIGIFIFAVFALFSYLNIGDIFIDLWVLFYVPILFYDLLFEVYFNGQSPGKMILKLRVVRIDGSSPSFVSYFIRWVLRIVDISLTFGSGAVITYMITGKGQRLGDVAAGTTVITLAGRNNLKPFSLRDYPENYVVSYPSVTRLSDSDVALLKEVLERTSHADFSESRRYELLLRVSNLIKSRLDVEINSSVKEIRKIIADYEFLASR